MEEITAEYSSEQLVPTQELRVKALVTVAAKTDLGRVRENNEDKFEFYVPEDDARLASRGQVFIVCDGMGGHAAGQIASELSVKTFIDVYYSHPSSDPEVAMTAAVVAANRFVTDVGRAVPARKGMGTTLSALVLLQEKAYTVQVGDSRIYRLRNGELLMLTHDHTWVDDAVRAGMITPAEAETHPYKHVLTRAIGGDADVKPDISSDDIQVGDTYLLCSDGLVNHVSDDTIGEVLRSKVPSEAAWNLVGQALQGGGSDNTTVEVVRIDALLRPEA
jgi:serine/threonine protein phosphatase PrpC